MSLKIFSLRPGRGCVKKGLPCILMAPRIVSTTRTGLRQMMAARAQQKSITRFKQLAYILSNPLLHTREEIPDHPRQARTGVGNDKKAAYSMDCFASLAMTYYALAMTCCVHNHSKHSLMVWMMASCCSGVILLSLGRQSPRAKISAPTSRVSPAM